MRDLDCFALAFRLPFGVVWIPRDFWKLIKDGSVDGMAERLCWYSSFEVKSRSS